MLGKRKNSVAYDEVSVFYLWIFTLHQYSGFFFSLLCGTGWLKWVQVGYFPSPMWNTSADWVGYFLSPGSCEFWYQPQQVDFWLTSFPWGQDLLRWTQYLSISYWFLIVTGSTLGFFSDISFEDLVKFLEVKLTKVWGNSYDLVPLEFLTLRVVHTEPSIVCWL